VCWITGASSGIGRALALRMAADGWTVCASARGAEALAALEREGGGRIHAVPLDVTDLAAVKAAVAGMLARHGRIGLAVLNAGTYIPDSAATFDSADFRRTYELNVMGAVHCLDAVLPHFIDRRAGHVALVASVAGYRGLPSAMAYGSSKAALIHLAESLRFEGDKHGFGVTIVNPGFVKTPLTDKNRFPMPFIVTAEQAADYMAEGLRKRDFEIVFPGRMAALMKTLKGLPYRLYFPAVHKTTGK